MFLLIIKIIIKKKFKEMRSLKIKLKIKIMKVRIKNKGR